MVLRCIPLSARIAEGSREEAKKKRAEKRKARLSCRCSVAEGRERNIIALFRPDASQLRENAEGTNALREGGGGAVEEHEPLQNIALLLIKHRLKHLPLLAKFCQSRAANALPTLANPVRCTHSPSLSLLFWRRNCHSQAWSWAPESTFENARGNSCHAPI